MHLMSCTIFNVWGEVVALCSSRTCLYVSPIIMSFLPAFANFRRRYLAMRIAVGSVLPALALVLLWAVGATLPDCWCCTELLVPCFQLWCWCWSELLVPRFQTIGAALDRWCRASSSGAALGCWCCPSSSGAVLGCWCRASYISDSYVQSW